MKAALLALLLVGCAKPAPSAPPEPSASRWRELRAELDSLRTARPKQPYGLELSLTLRHERLGQSLRARGLVAVSPPEGLRMILLGPGGTTAFDLWACGDRFRLAIPAADLLRRGDARTPSAELRGLPVGFLRWWFLRPYSGRPLFATDTGAGQRFLLRDDDHALVDILRTATTTSVRRAFGGDEERIEAEGGVCGKVRYRQRSTGVALEVECRHVNDQPPPARAFADPDEPERACGSAS
jgi:hypothetical protein